MLMPGTFSISSGSAYQVRRDKQGSQQTWLTSFWFSGLSSVINMKLCVARVCVRAVFRDTVQAVFSCVKVLTHSWEGRRGASLWLPQPNDNTVNNLWAGDGLTSCTVGMATKACFAFFHLCVCGRDFGVSASDYILHSLFRPMYVSVCSVLSCSHVCMIHSAG